MVLEEDWDSVGEKTPERGTLLMIYFHLLVSHKMDRVPTGSGEHGKSLKIKNSLQVKIMEFEN